MSKFWYNLKNFGIHGPEHVDAVGANAKMNEFAAVMGLCNLNHINEYISGRGKIVQYYENELENVKGIRVLTDSIADNRNYGYFPIIVEDDYALTRDELADKFAQNGIYARKYFYPLTSEFECYKDKTFAGGEKTPVAKYVSEHILTLPMYADLGIENVDRICDLILE